MTKISTEEIIYKPSFGDRIQCFEKRRQSCMILESQMFIMSPYSSLDEVSYYCTEQSTYNLKCMKGFYYERSLQIRETGMAMVSY